MTIRAATAADLPSVLALIADDGRLSQEPAAAHRAAFAAIEADPRNEVLVLEEAGGAVIGCLQITYIPGLGQGGRERAHLEAIRVRADRRGAGLGRRLIGAAIERARDRGCGLVQLTSNKRRTDAHRFYGSLGFQASHEGFKLPL